jgi:hypothetical protein
LTLLTAFSLNWIIVCPPVDRAPRSRDRGGSLRLKRYGMSEVASIQDRSSPNWRFLARGLRRRLFSSVPEALSVNAVKRLQLQIPLPYARPLRDDARVRSQLDLGWRIAQVQRLSDQEVLVTFESTSA